MEDLQTWQKYPHMRDWFNKLHLALKLGYDCGPAGIPPTRSGWYCIRPTYNIGGMGVGARKQWICAGSVKDIEPGYFWCEWFEGDQYSVSYKREQNYSYTQISCFKAERGEDLYKFKRWTRSDHQFNIHPFIESLLIPSDVEVCNIEFIGDKVVEIHFRDSPDPDYDELIPIWNDEAYLIDVYKKSGYKWITSRDDSNGNLKNYRLGFMVKCN